MPNLSPAAQGAVADAAHRHGFSPDAALAVFRALLPHAGGRAQFSHPELGGMGQWLGDGTAMIGDMFNTDLRRRVDALCTELAEAARQAGPAPGGAGGGAGSDASSGAGWWPAELGIPSASGGQNGLRYACFPAARRLAVQRDGRLEVYDTGHHRITGVSQASGGLGSMVLTGDAGPVRLQDLRAVGAGTSDLAQPRHAEVRQPAPAQPDPLSLIERLAELRGKGILTEEEFTAKKTELLGRL